MTNTATNMAIRTTRVKIPNGDLHSCAYLAEPEGEGTFPAVIVIEEIFGVNIHIREVTERLAKEGYVAMSGDKSLLFSRRGYANETLRERAYAPAI